MSKKYLPLKGKHLPLVLVAFLVLTVLSGMSTNIGGNMPDTDGDTYKIHQTAIPPVIDGNVHVGWTWPSQAFIGHMVIKEGGADVPVAEVYVMIDWLENPNNPYVAPAGYAPEDWTGFYLYIGIKAIPPFEHGIGYTGNWVLIDWDQDGVVDFADHDGNSAGPGKNGGYSTQFAYMCGNGVEWAIPYFDVFNGQCCSPFDIIIHIEATGCDTYFSETATFPGGRTGGFLSTTFCIWELIEPDPPCSEFGIRTIGFWKHQFRTHLGINKGHQHVSDADLLNYVSYISTYSTVDELNGDDMDSAAEALAILENREKYGSDWEARMRAKTIQQLLATYLNYVSGNKYADLNGDGVFETNIKLEVIDPTEAALNSGDPSQYEYYKDLCDAVNNSGPE
jgi:hypothetical protein